MTFLALLLLIFVCLNNQTYQKVEGGRSISPEEEDLELERQLMILNKPGIKTIQTEVGDVYNCVDIQQQPGLDHPLLKNHKVQTKPTSYPEGLADAMASSPGGNKRATLLRIGCPEGTVPIKRVGKEELRAGRHFSESLRLTNQVGPQQVRFPGIHQVGLKLGNGRFKGVKAEITVYNLTIAPNHFSTAHVWFAGDSDGFLNALWAGWMVSPTLYGDGLTRLFGHWATDAQNGCFNTYCAGFIVTSKDQTLGIPIAKSSTYGGVQYAINVMIQQDKTSGHYWLYVENEPLGYWLNVLVPLQGGANTVAWGGVTRGPTTENSSPLGNGFYPQYSTKTACFFSFMKIIDANNNLIDTPASEKNIYLDCQFYSAKYFSRQKQLGDTLLFGGPGGKCDH